MDHAIYRGVDTTWAIICARRISVQSNPTMQTSLIEFLSRNSMCSNPYRGQLWSRDINAIEDRCIAWQTESCSRGLRRSIYHLIKRSWYNDAVWSRIRSSIREIDSLFIRRRWFIRQMVNWLTMAFPELDRDCCSFHDSFHRYHYVFIN